MDRMGGNDGEGDVDDGPEEPLFPQSVGNWTIDHSRGFFPSLFALQFQYLSIGEIAEGSQPEEHVSQQRALARVVYGLCFAVFTCMIIF